MAKGIDLLRIELHTKIVKFIFDYFNKTQEDYVSLDLVYGCETFTGMTASFDEDGKCESIELESTYIDNSDGLLYEDKRDLSNYWGISELYAIYEELTERLSAQ